MKITGIIFCVCFCSISSTYSQKDIKLDSNSIEFKAKLMTVNRFGLLDKPTLISNIESQELKYLESGSDNIILMKISFNQKNYHSAIGVYINWIGSCDFYIAFNVDKAKFYRIGGFDILDLSDFFDDLGPKDLDLFDLGSDKALDFYCLKSHSELPKRKRKLRNVCLPCCSDEMKTQLKVFDAKK